MDHRQRSMNPESEKMVIGYPQSKEGIGDSDEAKDAGQDYANHNVY